MNSSNSWRVSNMSSCPKLRIEGFTDAWEQRKLSDIVDKAVDNRGKTPPISKEGTHPLIEVASLGNGVPDYAKVTKYLDDESFNTALRDYIKEDDILFSTVGSIGLVSLMDSREDAAIAQNIVSFRAKKNYDAKYIYAMFSTSDNQDKAWRIAMHGVQPSIKVSQLINVLYCVSNNFDEQKQIGEFFINLDNLITLHQRKSDALKNAKKYFLKNMFPSEGEKFPKLRLEGFTDAWEQRKLGKLGSLKNGMNFSKEAMGKGYPFVNLQNIFGRNTVDIENLGLAEASPKQLADYNLRQGDVLFVRSSVKLEGVGEAALVQRNLENTTYSGFIIRFRDEYGLDSDFKKYVFGTPEVRNQILSKATNSANKNISQSVLEDLEFKFPKLEEQQKIGLFLSSIDHLITLHQRKCDALKNAKKFFLQNMFV